MEIRDVERLAELARIELTENEKKSLLKDFDSILAYVDMIRQVDVGDVHARHDLYNAWREDALERRDFSRDLLIGQFPDAQNGFLKVKKIL